MKRTEIKEYECMICGDRVGATQEPETVNKSDHTCAFVPADPIETNESETKGDDIYETGEDDEDEETEDDLEAEVYEEEYY